MKIATTMAATVGDKGSFQKAVAKQGFPWKEFGFAELAPDADEDDYEDDEFLTEKPPPPHRLEGESPEFDYILGDGNMKGAMKDNSRIGNIDLAVSPVVQKRA